MKKDKKIMDEVVELEPEETNWIWLTDASCDLMFFVDDKGYMSIQMNVPKKYVKLLENQRYIIAFRGC